MPLMWPASPAHNAPAPVGIRFTGKGRAAQCLAGFDFLVPVLEQLRGDRALRWRLTLLGLDADPALRHAAIGRCHDVRAIILPQGAMVCELAWARVACVSGRRRRGRSV